MIAYKLLRLRKDGTLGPLFVGRNIIIPVSTWMKAQVDLPHPGLAHRPGFHCCSTLNAPHIKLQLKSGERRVWCMVQIEDYDELRRPHSQGGLWYIATHMKILAVLSDTTRKEKHMSIEQIKEAWANVKKALEAIPDTDATTISDYWDCECDVDYIHSMDEFRCHTCGREREADESTPPDSRLREVMLLLMERAGYKQQQKGNK